MKKVLITGCPGFAASQLAKLLIEKGGYDIHGTHRVRSDFYRLDKLGIKDKITYHLIELTDSHSVYDVIKKVRPHQIYHLAAQDYVKSSWEAPHETFNTNVNGTINLFMAIKEIFQPEFVTYETTGGTAVEKVHTQPKILVTSTSETYGYHSKPIDETTPQTPINPYGISKLAQDQLARLYCIAFGVPTVVTRSFNVTGWGRNDPFVDSNFAKQIAMIERGKQDPVIKHGNLEAKRTFFDVADAVRGYHLAMESDYDQGDVFCFGAAQSTSIADLLDILISLSEVKIDKKVDEHRFRPVDTPDMMVDYAKARKKLKWMPVIPLRISLMNLLNYWRERL